METHDLFELKSTDLGGRIGSLRTKSSRLETPALLPVIHPVRQLVTCNEIGSMGYEAVMTNAYTTYKRLRERAKEGIHKIIDFSGTVMTDSGGYQVLEFGAVDIQPEEIARFEEKIGSDIAIILDKPTGLDVTRSFASTTVRETLLAAKRTKEIITRNDIVWTLPIQGGKYLDLVSKSAKFSADLDYGCYALGSPVEVMEQYNFALLVRMIIACKKFLPQNRPFHLFGAGHPLILPLAIALGCDMFDSASYMLYAKEDRYISSGGTIRLEDLEYLACSCKVCNSLTAKEMKMLTKEERTISLARHNLAMLKNVIDETKQSIWEGRLWEYLQATCRNHPKTLDALRVAVAASERSSDIFDIGTAAFKEKGLFNFEKIDLSRPEIKRHRQKIKSIDLSKKKILLILPETKTKPFLRSEIFEEVRKILSTHLVYALVTFLCPNFGLIPAELSDVYPLSQHTSAYQSYPSGDPILGSKIWTEIFALVLNSKNLGGDWLRSELSRYLKLPVEKINLSSEKVMLSSNRTRTRVKLAHSYKELKQLIRKSSSQV